MTETFVCSKCLKKYKLNHSPSVKKNTAAIMRCRTCGLTICDRCEEWEQVKKSKCPRCGIAALWELKEVEAI